MKNQSNVLMTVGCAVATASLLFGTSAHAALGFWTGAGSYNNPGNWSGGFVPGPADLAVHNSGLPPIGVAGNWDVDSLRLSSGGSVVQTAGTVTIVNGVGPDNGLWVGEFGPNPTSYTLSGGTVQINDPVDGFMVGRAGGSIGTFNLNSGTVNNTVGDTHIGLDGRATWNQNGGTFNAGGVHVGRFASPTATVNLGGTAVWNSGLLLMSDFFLGGAIQSDFNIKGPGITLDTVGIVMKSIANLTFDGTGGGLSTLDLNGGIFLLDNGELFLNNLPTPSFLGQTITLIDNMGAVVGPDAQFDNAVDGTLYGGWEIDYTGSQVRLVSVVPEPTSLALVGLGALAMVARRKRK